MKQQETIKFKDAFTPAHFVAACNALGLDLELIANEWDLALGMLSEDIAQERIDLYEAGQQFLDLTIENQIDLSRFNRYSVTKLGS